MDGNLVFHDVSEPLSLHREEGGDGVGDKPISPVADFNHLMYSDIDSVVSKWRVNHQVGYCFVTTGSEALSTSTISVMREAFVQAEEEINALGHCLTFLEWPMCDTRFEMIWVGKYAASSCYMRSGSPVRINLGWCDKSWYKGSMIHEIGHALGLGHEHKRPDRDGFVRVNFDDIPSDWASQYTACKLPTSTICAFCSSSEGA
ncbi:MAG: hypothetical protein SGPRY_014948 [Prymnesium sp.]